jgi:hypothetical protein
MEHGALGPAPAAAAPDLIMPVIGYRQWRLRDAALWSPYAEMRWARGANTAACAARGATHREPSPVASCTCGLHAWYRPCPWLASAGTPDLVAGAVALWGAIELHPTGMRAQHAMVVALTLPLSRGAKRRRLIEVARALEVPAVPAWRLDSEALRCWRPIGPDLVPRPRSRRRSRR